MLRTALIALLVLVPIAAQTWGDLAGGWAMIDYRAYTCAADVLARGEDPYRDAPLHACEARAQAPGIFRAPPRVTVPAPYPAYALLAIRPFVWMNPLASMLAWTVLMLAACIASVALLAHLVRSTFAFALAGLGLSLGLCALPSGQIAPLCVLALLGCAAALQSGRHTLAALCATFSLIEPHVGLPAVVAVAIWVPRARLALVAGALALAAGSLLFSNPAYTLEYIFHVLPAHALSEFSRDNQYSLTTILAAAGFPDELAVRLGTISFALVTGFAIVLCGPISRKFGAPAYIALLPPALSVLGGSFVHTVEMAAAVPAAMLFATQPGRQQNLARIALLLLAVPWIYATSAALFLAPLFPVAWFVYAFTSNARRALVAAGVASACVLALFALSHYAGPSIGAAQHAHAFIDPALAQRSWRDFVLGSSTNRLATWLLRLPTWIGLVTLAWAATRSIQASAPNGIATAIASAR